MTFKNNELRSALSLQAAQQQKLYMEGYLLVQHITTVDGQPAIQRHEKFSEWTECFVQLCGTTLSIWDAAKLAAAGDELVPPSFINVTDAFVDFVGMHIDTPLTQYAPRNKFYHVFALNSAGSNRMLFCYSVPPPCDSGIIEHALLPEYQHVPEHNAVIHWLNNGHRVLQAWINAIRLASWERVRLDEIYTGALIRARLSAMRAINGSDDELVVRTPLVRGRYEGWVNARFMGSTEWRRCWMVLNDHRVDDEQPSFWRILRQKPGDRSSAILGNSRGAPDVHDVPPPPPGTLGSPAVAFFYESKKAKKPFASLWHVRHVFAVYPSCVDLVESSSLFKVEGCLPQCTINSATHRPRQTGWVMFMPEAKVSQPRGENAEMMKWIIAFMDAFHLYGRPNSFAWDARDPESPFFAYPIGPFKDRLFLDRTLAEYLDITVEDHLSTRRQLHDIMTARMRGTDTPILPPLPSVEAPANAPARTEPQQAPTEPNGPGVDQAPVYATRSSQNMEQNSQSVGVGPQYASNEYYVDQNGYYVDQNGYYVDQSGNHIGQNYQYVDPSDGNIQQLGYPGHLTAGALENAHARATTSEIPANLVQNSAASTTPITFPEPSVSLTAGAFQGSKASQKQPETSYAQGFSTVLPQQESSGNTLQINFEPRREHAPSNNIAVGSTIPSTYGSNTAEGVGSATTLPSAYSRASYATDKSPAALVKALNLDDAPTTRPPEPEWSLVSPSRWRIHTSSTEPRNNIPTASEGSTHEPRTERLQPTDNTPSHGEVPVGTLRSSALGVDLGDNKEVQPTISSGVPTTATQSPPASLANDPPNNFVPSAPRHESGRLTDRLRMLPQIDTTPLMLKRRDGNDVGPPVQMPVHQRPIQPKQHIAAAREETQTRVPQTRVQASVAQPQTPAVPAQHPSPVEQNPSLPVKGDGKEPYVDANYHAAGNIDVTNTQSVLQHRPQPKDDTNIAEEPHIAQHRDSSIVPEIQTTDTSGERNPVQPLAGREFPSSFGHRRLADSRAINSAVHDGTPRPGRTAQYVSTDIPSEDETEEEIPAQKLTGALRSSSGSQLDPAASLVVPPPSTESQEKTSLRPASTYNIATAPGPIPHSQSFAAPSPSWSRSTLSGTPRSTFVRLEPDGRSGMSYTPSGLVATASQEKLGRSARAKELEARDAGGRLVDVPSKPPPPQAGLMGSIRPGERQRPASAALSSSAMPPSAMPPSAMPPSAMLPPSAMPPSVVPPAAALPVPGSPPQSQMMMNMYWPQQQMMMMGMPPPMPGANVMAPEAMSVQQQALLAAHQAYMQTMSQVMNTDGRPRTMDYGVLGYPQMPYGEQGR